MPALSSRINIEAFYHIFRDIGLLVHSSSDVRELLGLVVKKTTEVVIATDAALRIFKKEEKTMYIQQTDLFRDVSKDFLKKIMHITVKESRGQGDYLFHEGDPAIYSYVLLKGRVDLSLGERGHVVFVVSRPGEAFGWSSIIGRDVYSASAECKAPTRLLKMDRDKFQKILENDQTNGFIFFKRLAGDLGNRLLQSYNQISAASQSGNFLSFGTGQILESTVAQ